MSRVAGEQVVRRDSSWHALLGNGKGRLRTANDQLLSMGVWRRRRIASVVIAGEGSSMGMFVAYYQSTRIEETEYILRERVQSQRINDT